MSPFHRAIATVVGSLAFTAAGIAGAGSALATPEDGEGCIGTPDVASSYICVISLTPEAALPNTTTTTVPVTVPSVCYFVGCTAKTTVDVPVPGVAPSDGVVAVLWYQGQYIPISVGTGAATELLNDAVDLAVDMAFGAIATVQDVVEGLPTTELLTLVNETTEFTVGAGGRVVACSLQLSCDPTIELSQEH